MSKKPATEADLAAEARRWESGELTPAGWEDSPDAVPRAGESVPISLRVPAPMLTILKEFARREGIGYQVLMKRWLDERIRAERDRLRNCPLYSATATVPQEQAIEKDAGSRLAVTNSPRAVGKGELFTYNSPF